MTSGKASTPDLVKSENAMALPVSGAIFFFSGVPDQG